MKISEDHRFFQEIVAIPRVLGAVTQHGEGVPDLETIWPWCVGVEFDDGGWIFQQLEGGYYEVHTLFRPKATNVVEKAKQALFFMFTATDALEIVTRVPRDLPHALKLARAGGFRDRFERPDGWLRASGSIPTDHLGLTIDEWVRDQPQLMALGEQEHGGMSTPIHDAYAGFLLACQSNGQGEKGRWRYNRWAMSSSYFPVGFADNHLHLPEVAPQTQESIPCLSQ